MIKGFLRAGVFLAIIAAAVFYVLTQVKSKEPSEHQDLQYPSKTVEVIHVEKIPFRVRSMAYGNIEPATVLNASTSPLIS